MRKVRDFIPDDAEGLAQCINESEGGWPGGISSGVQHTAEHVMEDYKRGVNITWLVAVSDDGKVAGVSTLHPHSEDPEAAYLGFLNVSDAYRKKGYGKALLLESVHRVAKEGYKRLFLETWAGNLNAVPVYKRTGFFWRPETEVLMENYIPTVLELPIAQVFFQKHDWYSSYDRKIEIEPDDMTHRGLRVYEIRWQKEKDSLRVLLDRESRSPTLIETSDIMVECWVANPEPALGVPLPIEWTIHNKNTTEPLSCQLTVQVPKGFHLIQAPPEKFTVKPGEKVTLQGSIQGQVKVVPPPKDKPALAIKSRFLIKDVSVELATGIRAKHPIEVSTVPSTLWCRPGNHVTLAFAIKSNLHAPAKCTLTLQTPRGLKLEQKQFDITLEPEGYSGIETKSIVRSSLETITLPVKIHAELQVNGQSLRTRTETRHLHCLTTGGILVTPYDDNKRLQIHTETLQFSINLTKGAHIDHLVNKLTKRKHLRSHCRDSIGPPFWPSEQMRTHFNHRIEQPGDGTTKIITWMKCQRYPGLEFLKTFVLTSAAPLIRIDYGFHNTHSNKSHEVQMQMGSMAGTWDHLHVLPLKDGILREEAVEAEFFASRRELPKKQEEWAETWYCAERAHKKDVTAILCDPSIFMEARGVIFLDFKFRIPLLKPKANITLPPVYIYAGPGRWQHIRQLWHQLYSQTPQTELTPIEPQQAIDVSTDVSPLLLEVKDILQVPVKLRHAVHRPLKGRIQFFAPKGWSITPRSQSFKDLSRTNPTTIPLTLTTSKRTDLRPRLLSIQARVKTSLRDHHYRIPLIMNRRSGKVVITKDREHDQQIYIIDTGTYQLKVASGFAGSVYALINKITGTNYLKSSFPKAGPLVWFNPWYGGIRFDPFPPGQPGWFPTKLDRESWTIRETHRDDWSGVTLQVKPRKEEQKLKGLQFEFQVLSQPHSNIIALVQRIVNLTKAPRQVHNRLKIGLNPEGSPKGLETVVPRFSGVLRRRRVSTHGWPTSAQPYLGVEHMKDEVTLLFVEKQSPNGELYLGDLAPEVVQIFTEDPIDISSKKTKERVSYLIISNEPWEQTTQYEILKNLQL